MLPILFFSTTLLDAFGGAPKIRLNRRLYNSIRSGLSSRVCTNVHLELFDVEYDISAAIMQNDAMLHGKSKILKKAHTALLRKNK